ncbi:MAG: hypothetical protein KatS3mg092_0673 [Patescibacteria group bacterium]|nr:MAG: hypothetical protein KatS3mg092_0673 [Patescibacteria group bacterium]
MKKILFGLLIFFSLFFAPLVKAEEIKSFDAQININKDETIDVIEKIVYDFGLEKRHGIFRTVTFIKKTKMEKSIY